MARSPVSEIYTSQAEGEEAAFTRTFFGLLSLLLLFLLLFSSSVLLLFPKSCAAVVPAAKDNDIILLLLVVEEGRDDEGDEGENGLSLFDELLLLFDIDTDPPITNTVPNVSLAGTMCVSIKSLRTSSGQNLKKLHFSFKVATVGLVIFH